MSTIHFHDVGRDKQSWSVDVQEPTEDVIVKTIFKRRALMSKSVVMSYHFVDLPLKAAFQGQPLDCRYRVECLILLSSSSVSGVIVFSVAQLGAVERLPSRRFFAL